MKSLRVIDSEIGPRRRRPKRRRYVTPGPNFLWHVDGWDKLAPFGIFVHGAIDRFSRRILWLEVNSTNKNPSVIASHYLNKVQQLGGFPGGCTATGERRIQLLAPFNSFFDGMVTTSLQVVVVLSKVKAVQTSVWRPGGQNSAREEEGGG